MLIEVKVPVLSESIAEATLVSWLKKAGETVAEDENLIDLETDKVVLEVVAPQGGVLREIRKGDGVTVASSEVIAIIDTDATNDASADGSAVNVVDSTQEPVKDNNDQKLSPAVRKLIAENHLDPASIVGNGKDGRLTKADVMAAVDAKSEQQRMADISPVTNVATNAEIVTTVAINDEQRYEKRVPMTRLRVKIAERLKQAQNTAAILSTFNELDMKPIMDLRAAHKDEFFDKHDVKLGFMSFFVKACVEALKQFPIINTSVDGNDIIYHGYYDFGIAIGSPRGLVVPVVRNVDRMSFADIEQTIVTLGKNAGTGKLTLEDLTGGTFSITNGGVYGSMLSTPILNPPQSAILGMHNIQERAVVIDGEIVIRPMMFVALSYDHRIIDGKDAVMFLVAVKKALENPVRLLLDL